MKTKYCPKCGKDKNISKFSKNRSAYDQLSSWCKKCNAEYQKEYYSGYVDKNRSKLKEYHSEYSKKHYQENKEKLIKQKIKYHNDRYKNNLEFRLITILRSRFYKAIKLNKESSINILLGCSIIQLKQYLESQFVKGMTWDNYGLNGWHIDHIKPCAKFDLSKEQEQLECFHYTNLQPLWAEDNLSKGSK